MVRRIELVLWFASLALGMIAAIVLVLLAGALGRQDLAEVGIGVVAGVIGLFTVRFLILAGRPGVFAEIVPDAGPAPEPSLASRAAVIGDAIRHPLQRFAR